MSSIHIKKTIKQKKNTRKQRFIFIVTFIILLVIFIPAFYFWEGYKFWSLKKEGAVEQLKKYNTKFQNSNILSSELKPVKIFDKNGILIGEYISKNFTMIRPNNLHEYHNLIWALLSAEDKRFFDHFGIDVIATTRAFLKNILGWKLTQGGSTITQQLAKLILNARERNLTNKIAITICAFYIENHFDKKTILSMYMNHVFLGEGNYGMEEASIRYFNKRSSKLTESEAALLAGIIPAPSLYNPIKNLKVSLQNQKTILEKMFNNLELCKSVNCKKDQFDPVKSQNEFKKIYRIKETISPNDLGLESTIGKLYSNKEFSVNLTPEFNESIKKILSEKFDKDEIETLGIKIFTTLDYQKQIEAEKFLNQELENVKRQILKKLKTRKKKSLNSNFEKNLVEGLNGFFLSIEPETGKIEVMAKRKENNFETFSQNEDLRRQPGSAIKGLIFALALEKKIISPSIFLIDEKIDISGYSPRNWYKGYRGKMSARTAFAQSVNTISVKLLHKIGTEYFLKKLAQILSKSEHEIFSRFSPNLSLALGSGELTFLELATIYATIANGGKRISPIRILKITDDRSHNFFTHDPKQNHFEDEAVLDETACAMTINLMEAVVSQIGTMDTKLPEDKKFPMAGKTGTVQIPKEVRRKWENFPGIRDSFFVGLVPSLLSVVWIGNNYGAPFISSKKSITGKIWLNTILRLKTKYKFEKELIPFFQGNFVKVDVCLDDEKIDSPDYKCKQIFKEQYYYRGMEPKMREKSIQNKSIESSSKNETTQTEDDSTETPEDLEMP